MAMIDYITIQQTTQTRGDIGDVVDSWSTYAACYADVTQISGNEAFTSEQVVYSDTKKFRVYYTSGSGVTAKMRIVYNSENYMITSVAHVDRLFTDMIAVRYDDE